MCLAFAGGIFLASRFFLPYLLIMAVLALCAGIFILTIFLGRSAFKRGLLIAALLLFSLSLGALRFYRSLQSSEYQSFFDAKVKWEAYVTEEPDIRADKQLLTVLPAGFEQKLLITTTNSQKFAYGDRLVLEGKIKEPKKFEDFDYPGYLERYGIYALSSYPKVLILKSGEGNFLKSLLLKTKQAFVARLSRFLPEPENGLALGILIGARKNLPEDIQENFVLTGTSHIVAISGYNITVIVTALGYLAWLIGRRAGFWLSLFFIFSFVIIAGGSASVIRAAAMGVLLLFAINSGRLYAASPALIFSGALMLFFNPKILYWDIGFQLSFVATLGLIHFMPLLDALTSNWPKFFGLKGAFLTTLAATFSTLPLILFYFGRLSTISLIANILVLPLVPLAMLFGFLSILPFVAPGFALLAQAILAYILWVTAKLAHLPFASLEISVGSEGFMLMAALLFGIYFILNRLAHKKSHAVETVHRLW